MKTKLKQICVASIIVLFILSSSMFVDAYTRSQFTITKDGGGDWQISSLDYALQESLPWQMFSRLGWLCIFVDGAPYAAIKCEDNRAYEYLLYYPGGWGDPIFDGPWAQFSPILLHMKFEKIKALYTALCETIGRGIFGFVYFADVDEAIIYLHPNKWKNPMDHAIVAYKINERRHYYLKEHPFLEEKTF